MVHFTTLKKIFEAKPHTILFFQRSYIAYTVLIIFVSCFVVSSLTAGQKDETCEEWSEIPTPAVADPSTTYNACTNLVSGSAEVLKVNGAASFMALLLFLMYLYYQGESLSLLRKIAPDLFAMKEDGVTPLEGAAFCIDTYCLCKIVILICVEIVGLYMIFTSTSNHDVIINSTAAFFLCELDAYVLNCIVQHYMLINPIKGEFEVELINIEFSTADAPEYFKKVEQERLKQLEAKNGAAAATIQDPAANGTNSQGASNNPMIQSNSENVSA